MSLTSVLLGDCLENFDRDRRPIKSTDRSPGPIPYIGASGVVDHVEGFTHDGDYLCVSEDGENLRSRNTPIAWVQRGKFWANNHLHVLGGVSLARLHFFAAAINHSNISSYLTGSAQPKLSQQSLNEVAISDVSVDSQGKIGEFLLALDDKIAANRRVADVARELVVVLASKVSTQVPLAELVSVHRSSIAPRDMTAQYVTQFSLPDFDEGSPSRVNPSQIKSGKTLLADPVVLVSKLNPRIPRIWAVDQVPPGMVVASPEFVALKPLDVPVATLWGALATRSFTTGLLARIAGTTGSHQRVKPAEMLEVEVPDVRKLNDSDTAAATSLIRKANAVVAENRVLAATRDELLPLLMSGKITVSDAEQKLESVV